MVLRPSVLLALSCLLLVGLIQAMDKAELSKSLTTIPAISKTWVINLPGRNERMEFMDKQLAGLKIPYQRFEAFDFGNGSDENTISAMQRLHKETKMNLQMVKAELERPVELVYRQSWGSVGCWQSHLQIALDIVYGDGSPYPGPFLILEDDVRVSSSLIKYLSYDYLYKTLPSDWEMLYLDFIGLTCHNATTSRYPIVENKEFCKIAFTYATGGYVIRNKEVARKLLDAGNTPQLQIADKYTNPLFRNETIQAYAILEKVVYQLPKAFGSDIRTPDALVKTIAKFYNDPKTNAASEAIATSTNQKHMVPRRAEGIITASEEGGSSEAIEAERTGKGGSLAPRNHRRGGKNHHHHHHNLRH